MQADLCLCCSLMAHTGFLIMWLIFYAHSYFSEICNAQRVYLKDKATLNDSASTMEDLLK